ncbi:hypothetical protein CLV36_10583 [Laceyella sediminis]|uniref:Uncharacterized protein n=1 Tax=Laceyella sediminis TaxID=573074 RepID=A0ABX5EPC4_9BACL|nr:hypothetical protein CLV36_10583 [Laceyella sediminis]
MLWPAQRVGALAEHAQRARSTFGQQIGQLHVTKKRPLTGRRWFSQTDMSITIQIPTPALPGSGERVCVSAHTLSRPLSSSPMGLYVVSGSLYGNSSCLSIGIYVQRQEAVRFVSEVSVIYYIHQPASPRRPRITASRLRSDRLIL